MSSSELIDWEQLDMIADGFTPDFVEIYQEYLLEMPMLLADLEQKIAADDVSNAAKVAHQIKGSSANFGFIGVSRPVAQVETTARDGSLTAAAELLVQAKNAFAFAMAEVKAKRGA